MLKREEVTEIANRLIVSGASFEGFSYLIIQALTDAKLLYQLNNDVVNSINRMKDVVAYVMLSTKEYNYEI